MKLLLLISMVIGLSYSFSQDTGKIILNVDDESVSYDIKRCYKRGKLVRTKSGKTFKVVVWNSYAPWSKTYSLIVRSLDGKYSTNLELKNLTENIEINFK